MSETLSSWAEQVKQVIADRAYSLNYDEGMQCRFMPMKSEAGSHTIEVLMEMTHSGHPFDLSWLVRFGDDPSSGIRFELAAPPTEGGTLWKDQYDSLDKLRADAQVVPVFIRGYFVGRKAVTNATGAEASAS